MTATTPVWRRWAPEDDTLLEQLWRHGLFDEEIGADMHRSPHAVRLRRNKLGLNVDPVAEFIGDFATSVGAVLFEDVTKEEARRISSSAPPSGRFSVQVRYSLVGSTAAMCTENEAWMRSPKRS